MAETYVLDACSLIAFLKKEHGGEVVSSALQAAASYQCKIYLHKATLAEAVYDLLRSGTFANAEAIFSVCYSLPIEISEELSDVFIEKLARFKITFKVSFADCFVLALAQVNDATVMTSDHHEFDAVEKSGEVKFHWFR